MNKFKLWYFRNYTEITWFIIGLLTWDAMYNAGIGNWLGVIVDAVLVAINYSFWRR